jgi:hypothetical protein
VERIHGARFKLFRVQGNGSYHMNSSETMKAIKALGLTVARTDGEWRINYTKLPGMTHDREATAYYTEDNDDALGTAKAMAEWPEFKLPGDAAYDA